MEFSFSFKTRKKQDKSLNKIDDKSLGKLNGSYFYPITFEGRASYEALKSMYEELPEVQAPVNYIIDKMANIHYDHVRKSGDNEVIIENSEPKKVMADPNQYMNESDLIKAFFLNRIVLGVGYFNRIVPAGFNRVKQLYILPTATTKPVIKENNRIDPRQNEIEGYITDFGNGEVKLTKEEVIAQHESNLYSKLDEVRSRLLSAILTSESLRYNYEARVKIYKDRGALGIVSPSDPNVALQPEQADYLRAQWANETGITGNKAPIRVSQAAMTYTSIGFSVSDLQLNENKLQDFQTICAVLNIDSALFENSRGSYNNKILAKKNYWEDVGMPGFNSFLQLLGEVFNLPDNEYFKADYSDIPALQEDYEKKVNANSKAWNDGVITEAEYREAIDYEGGEDKTKTELEANRAVTTTETD